MQGFYTLIGFLFVAGACLLAQTNSTAILRTVVDPSGAIVAGAGRHQLLPELLQSAGPSTHTKESIAPEPVRRRVQRPQEILYKVHRVLKGVV
jgi:hypothetical protein